MPPDCNEKVHSLAIKKHTKISSEKSTTVDFSLLFLYGRYEEEIVRPFG